MADLPIGDEAHVTGQFRAVSPTAPRPAAEIGGLRRRLSWIRFALGHGYRSCQITIASPQAKALDALFVKEGPVRVNPAMIGALGTLIHEEFHALHFLGWSGIAMDLLLDAPGLGQLSEGVVDTGVEELLPSLLPRLGLGGLTRAVPLLERRRSYVAQKSAVRGLLDFIAGLVNVPAEDLLKRTIRWGSRMMAMRNLAHDIARAQGLEDRVPDWQWPVIRLQRAFPDTVESRIIREVLRPFDQLGEWARGGDIFGEAAAQQGRIASAAAILGLRGFLKKAA